jgi:hypothetical protein
MRNSFGRPRFLLSWPLTWLFSEGLGVSGETADVGATQRIGVAEYPRHSTPRDMHRIQDGFPASQTIRCRRHV